MDIQQKSNNMQQNSGFFDNSIPHEDYCKFRELIPPKKLNMEGALEFCGEDECVEVTPAVVRIRKVILDQGERARSASRAKKANQNA